MAMPPRHKKSLYNQKKCGYSGKLGRGGNAVIRFVQTAVTPDELDAITLIENIQGSERWQVRDLFQRDVDKARVTNSIIPYFQNDSKVKFFNPLTLMVLPVSDERVESELPEGGMSAETIDDIEYGIEEHPGAFRFAVHPDEPAYSFVEWNDRRVKVVAIDGQHRLSALKRWKKQPAGLGALSDWTIPVVILGIFKDGDPAPKLLDVVRKTFIYINSTAATVNPARRILLDDESVNAICVQEIVQDSHSNDCLPIDERTPGRVPLMFFDWRGETENEVRKHSPGAVKRLEEVYSWCEYILGEDGGSRQEVRLELEDLIPPLTTFGLERKLSHADSERIRAQFRVDILPALQHVLEQFGPYRKYIAAVREMERSALRDSDYAQHAFMKIRFGTHQAGEEIVEYVDEKYRELVDKLTLAMSSSFDQLLNLDVGMRAVMYAFAELKDVQERNVTHLTSWVDYARPFVGALDSLYEERWFADFDGLAKAQRDILTHVVYDTSGGIINYRIGDQASGLGALLGLFLAARLGDDSVLIEAWDKWGDALRNTAERSLKRQVKAELRDTFTGTIPELNAAVKKQARERADRWQEGLLEALELELG